MLPITKKITKYNHTEVLQEAVQAQVDALKPQSEEI